MSVFNESPPSSPPPKRKSERASTAKTAAKSKPAVKRAAKSSAAASTRKSSTSSRRKPAAKASAAPNRRPLWQRALLGILYSIYWLVYQLALRFWLLGGRGKATVGLALVLIGVLTYALTRPPASRIAPFFMPSVQYWASDITRWADQYGVDPNMIATLMQIESCGWPGAESSAGAQGLFQVMPFHFSEDEKSRMTVPEINAKRGMGVIIDCLQRADGDAGLAMACYNGGPVQITRPQAQWPAETRRYYTWGGGIYREAKAGASQSATLQNWLDAGGVGLCRRAESALNIQPPTALPSDFTPAPAQPGALPTFAGR